jgi:hypothetical protein
MTAPTFYVLSEAVEFIADCLDNEDYDKLLGALTKQYMVPGAAPELREEILQSRLRAIHLLKERHQQIRLDLLYEGKVFPSGATAYKLGGHGKELGHLHIDFRKVNGDWALEEIFVCR